MVCHEGISDFKGSHGFQISGIVSSHYFQHFRCKDGPHDRGVLSQRIEDLYESSFPGILFNPYIVNAFRAYEGIGLDFVCPHSAHYISCDVLDVSVVGLPCLVVALRNGNRKIIVAVKPCNLLDDIFFDFDVLSYGRSGYIHVVPFAFDFHFKAFKIAHHLFSWKFDS